MVYGGLDGIVTRFFFILCGCQLDLSFTVIAGAAGGDFSTTVVLVLGFASLIGNGDESCRTLPDLCIRMFQPFLWGSVIMSAHWWVWFDSVLSLCAG